MAERCRCKRRLSSKAINGIVDVLHNAIQFYDERGQKNNDEYAYLIEVALRQECVYCYRPQPRRRRK